jgi:uncharacterized damage-inducible protein DinB
MTANLPEVWLRGPVEGVPPLLQPVAHALLQAVEEVQSALHDFPDGLLWERPAGVAAVGFHLQHLTGVLDRLTTYASGGKLNEQQLAYLKAEGTEIAVSTAQLVTAFSEKVDEVIGQLKTTEADSVTAFRAVGRKALPSTVLGLLFHAAEHTMRHLGQLLVTAKIVPSGKGP